MKRYDVYQQRADVLNRAFVGRFKARNAVHAVETARRIVHVGDVAIESKTGHNRRERDYDIRQA